MTHREWYGLKPGDYIKSKTGRSIRKVLGSNNGSITLFKLIESRYPSKFTVYANCDKYRFDKIIIRE